MVVTIQIHWSVISVYFLANSILAFGMKETFPKQVQVSPKNLGNIAIEDKEETKIKFFQHLYGDK